MSIITLSALQPSSWLWFMILAGGGGGSAAFLTRYLFYKSSKFRFIIRCLLFSVCVICASLYGGSIAPFLYVIGKGGLANHYTGRFFYGMVRRLCGVTCRIIQPSSNERLLDDPPTPCVYLVNHQATLDMVAMGAAVPKNTAILAKEEIKYYPLMGQYMQLARNVFINRQNHSSAIETMAQIARRIKEQKLGLWMYPEGTRSHQRDNSLLPFKKGAFHLAIQGGIPIIPVVTSTYYPHYSEAEMKFEPCEITIRVLDPIQTTGLGSNDVNALVDKTRDTMVDALKSISTKSHPSANKKLN